MTGLYVLRGLLGGFLLLLLLFSHGGGGLHAAAIQAAAVAGGWGKFESSSGSLKRKPVSLAPPGSEGPEASVVFKFFKKLKHIIVQPLLQQEDHYYS